MAADATLRLLIEIPRGFGLLSPFERGAFPASLCKKAGKIGYEKVAKRILQKGKRGNFAYFSL